MPKTWLILLARTHRVLLASAGAWIEHRSASKGAALAFYTLFSLTPILILAIAVVGRFFGAEAARGEIIAQVQGLIGPNGAHAIQALLAASQDRTSGMVATGVASVLLLVGATTVFAELKDSLDDMWGNEFPLKSGFGMLIRTRLLAFGLVLVLAILLLISLMVSAVFALLESYTDVFWSGSAEVFAYLSSLISFSVIACLFAVINKMLPQIRLSWNDVWSGAVFTAALFSLGKFAIGLYLSHSGIASSFGAAGSLIALLLWVYYSALIFFFGAEFTRQYALKFGSLQQQSGSNN